jgi:hypothetical protein
MFPREWCSFDLGFDLDYAAPLVRNTSRDVATESWRKRADVLSFGVLLGLSTWF